MKVLKATQAQYDTLDGYTNGPNRLEFRLDGNTPSNWVIGKGCLTDPAYEEIRPQLLELEEIDWVPPPPEEEEE